MLALSSWTPQVVNTCLRVNMTYYADDANYTLRYTTAHAATVSRPEDLETRPNQRKA